MEENQAKACLGWSKTRNSRSRGGFFILGGGGESTAPCEATVQNPLGFDSPPLPSQKTGNSRSRNGYFLFFGGIGGSRTPVRKPIHTSFYTFIRSFKSPLKRSDRQDHFSAALWIRRGLQGAHPGRWLLNDAPLEAAALIGRTEAALRQLLIQIYCLRLILKCPF